MFWDNIKQSVQLFIGILILIIIYYTINIGNRYVEEEKKILINNKKLAKIFIFSLFIYIIYMLIKKFHFLLEIINILIFSAIFAYILNPTVNYIERKGVKRFWGVIIVYLVLGTIIFVLSFVFVPKVVKEFKNLALILPNYLDIAYKYMDEIYYKYYLNLDNLPPQLDGIKGVFRENIDNVMSLAINWISKLTRKTIGIFSKIFIIVLIPIISFYFIKDKEFFKKKLYLTIPKPYRNHVLNLSKEIDITLSSFIRGKLIVALFVGTTTTIALVILKINFALIIGIIAGLTDIIPYFGPVIGIIPAVFFALLEGPIKAIWVVVIFTIIQQVENDIITPKIVGESVGIHPVTVILSLIVGGNIFGILGMILAIPLVAIIKIVYTYIIENLNRS